MRHKDLVGDNAGPLTELENLPAGRQVWIKDDGRLQARRIDVTIRDQVRLR